MNVHCETSVDDIARRIDWHAEYVVVPALVVHKILENGGAAIKLIACDLKVVWVKNK